MATLEKLRGFGKDIENLTFLRTAPVAVKLLKSEAEIPDDSLRPKKDLGGHIALCQAFALARRQRLSITMLKEDHWCFEPLIAYGLVEPPESYLEGLTSYPFFISDKEAAARRAREAARLPLGKYVGLSCAPLEKVKFEPDVVLVYCNPGQLRHLLLAIRYKDGYQVSSKFDPIGSCVNSVIPSLLTGECYITIPDPGEYERAIACEDEIIFSVPRKRLEDLMLGLWHLENSMRGYKKFTYLIRPDFPQPPFYQEYFRMWGLSGAGDST
ncbi:MAG: DUF169 domain-containing protein [Candidatus Bathyarchaeia archaeon]